MQRRRIRKNIQPSQCHEYPELRPIFGGKWSAHGDGWAVHGDTQEEALENYRKAEQHHKEILDRHVIDWTRYPMTINWSDGDGVFVVKVPSLPGCMTHGSTYDEAVQQGHDAIESWLNAG